LRIQLQVFFFSFLWNILRILEIKIDGIFLRILE
jgi:hypothetical protein